MGKDPYNFYHSWQEVKVLYKFIQRKKKRVLDDWLDSLHKVDNWVYFYFYSNSLTYTHGGNNLNFDPQICSHFSVFTASFFTF